MDFRDKIMTQSLPLCDTVDRESHPKWGGGGEISSVLKNGRESEISMWMLRQLTSVEKRKCHSIKRSKDQGAPAMGLLEGRRPGRGVKQMPQPYRLTTSRPH